MIWPFSFLKKICWGPHGKTPGQPYPENLREIFRFSPYKKEIDRIGYGVHECTGCKRRMFSCVGYHMMGPQAEKTIDAFIAHKITREEFIAFLQKEMAWFEESIQI